MFVKTSFGPYTIPCVSYDTRLVNYYVHSMPIYMHALK